MYLLKRKDLCYYFDDKNDARKDACVTISYLIDGFNLDKCSSLEMRSYVSILECIEDGEFESAINMWNSLSSYAVNDNYFSIIKINDSGARDIDNLFISDTKQKINSILNEEEPSNNSQPQVIEYGNTCSCGYYSEYSQKDPSYLCPQCKLMKGVFC